MYHQCDGGKAAFRFWGRFHQSHCNRNIPLTYNGENDVSMLMPSVLIRSSPHLQVTRTGIKSRTNSNVLPDQTTLSQLGALVRLKNSHSLILGKWCLQASTLIFDRIFAKLDGNQDRHKISKEFEFRPNRISHIGVRCP